MIGKGLNGLRGVAGTGKVGGACVATLFRKVTVKEQGIGDINSKLVVIGFIFVCM